MDITEVSIKLMPPIKEGDRLLAFANLTLDGMIAVRGLKVIRTDHGLIVAMPARKLTDHCGNCGYKGELSAYFCGGCGQRLPDGRVKLDSVTNRPVLYQDVVFPICYDAREIVERAVLSAYREAVAKASGVDQQGRVLS